METHRLKPVLRVFGIIFEVSLLQPARGAGNKGRRFQRSTLLRAAKLSGVHALGMPAFEADARGPLLHGHHDFVFTGKPADGPVEDWRRRF